jgi:phosphotransferase system HPr (HPr) family protein
MKVKKTVIVRPPSGLHARPAMEIVQILQHSRSRARILYEDRLIDAHSILSLLSLAAPCGTAITLMVEGVDAKVTLKKLIETLSRNTDEP